MNPCFSSRTNVEYNDQGWPMIRVFARKWSKYNYFAMGLRYAKTLPMMSSNKEVTVRKTAVS